MSTVTLLERSHRLQGPQFEVSWPEFGELCKKLALDISQRGPFDALVGIARGGSIVGATLSFMLNLPYFPIRLARQRGSTKVLVPPSRDLAGLRTVLVDDLSRTGETFRIAELELKRVGVPELLSVALVRREPGYRPDLCAMTASAADKVIFPWGREELVSGRFERRKL